MTLSNSEVARNTLAAYEVRGDIRGSEEMRGVLAVAALQPNQLADTTLQLANLHEALRSAYDTNDDGRAEAIEKQILALQS